MDIIISIKPLYTNFILIGTKTIEIRKKIGLHFSQQSKIYIYSSTPVKAMVATANIKSIRAVLKKYVTDEELIVACISRTEFEKYLGESSLCYLIELENVLPFSKILPLKVLQQLGFTAPQSFCYADQKIINLIKAYL